MFDQEPQTLAQEEVNNLNAPAASLLEAELQIGDTASAAGRENSHAEVLESTSSATSARAEAARRNGSKSHGPITEEGKNRSRMNALKHGLRGTLLLQAGTETENNALQALRERVEQEFPVWTLEQELLRESMVHALWQKLRCFKFEARELSQEMIFHSAITDRLLRYGNAADKRLFRCLAELKRLQEQSTPAPEPISGEETV